MKLTISVSVTTLALLGVAINACSTTDTALFPGVTPNSGDGGGVVNGAGGEGGKPGGGSDSGSDASAATPDVPHALGRIQLGEFHASGATTTTPIVSAGFIPDSVGAVVCAKQVSGCTMNVVPKCTGALGKGCAADESCSLDPKTCSASCVPLCTANCGSDEECYFPSPSAPACRKIETFDAGALAFAGTTTPLTLYPPYSYSSMASTGALFLAGGSLEVQASGATNAGFDKFDEKFTATQFIQTSPSLDQIPQSVLFGTGSIPVSWAAGRDQVIVTVSGLGGSATCTADDSAGKFQIPRALVTAVLGDATTTSTLTISVGRQRTEVKKDAHTKGVLATATVQSAGWLELVTSSTESTSFQACPAAAPFACGTTCVNTKTDTENCGACGNACTGVEMCSNGVCSAPCPAADPNSCASKCVNLKTDTKNCGTCGHTCPAADKCANGTCAASCPAATPNACGSACVDLQTDNQNCGTCGNVCNGVACAAGVCSTVAATCETCADASKTGACQTTAVACSNDPDCAAYQTCSNACTDDACFQTCGTSHAAGAQEYNNYANCVCNTACTTLCASECSAN